MTATSRRAVDRLARRAGGRPPSLAARAELDDALAELRTEVEQAAADPRPSVQAAMSRGLADLLDNLTGIVGHRMTATERADNARHAAELRAEADHAERPRVSENVRSHACACADDTSMTQDRGGLPRTGEHLPGCPTADPASQPDGAASGRTGQDVGAALRC